MQTTFQQPGAPKKPTVLKHGGGSFAHEIKYVDVNI